MPAGGLLGVEPLQRRGRRRGNVFDLDQFRRLFRRRQLDDQRAAQNGIGSVEVKRPAHPSRLALRGRAEDVRRLFLDVADVELARVEHQFRGARVEPLDLECDGAEQHLVVKIDPQVQLQMRDAKLLDVGEGVVVEARLKRGQIRVGGRGCRPARQPSSRTAARQRSSCFMQAPTARRLAFASRTAGALARPPSNSLKVFSSTSRPDLPSQLEPSGKVFSTSTDCASTASSPSGCR